MLNKQLLSLLQHYLLLESVIHECIVCYWNLWYMNALFVTGIFDPWMHCLLLESVIHECIVCYWNLWSMNALFVTGIFDTWVHCLLLESLIHECTVSKTTLGCFQLYSMWRCPGFILTVKQSSMSPDSTLWCHLAVTYDFTGLCCRQEDMWGMPDKMQGTSHSPAG